MTNPRSGLTRGRLLTLTLILLTAPACGSSARSPGAGGAAGTGNTGAGGVAGNSGVGGRGGNTGAGGGGRGGGPAPTHAPVDAACGRSARPYTITRQHVRTRVVGNF